MTEYSGRGWALFRIGRDVELFVGLTLIASFYLGGIANPIEFVLKTGGLLVVTAGLQALFCRLRIDQTVGLWWRIGILLALGAAVPARRSQVGTGADREPGVSRTEAAIEVTT